MELKEIIERLRKIAATRPLGLTRDDKEFVKEQAEAFGVPFEKTRCRDCYIDAAVAIFAKIKEKDEAAVVGEIKRWQRAAYSLKNGVDVYWQGERVNEATATAESVVRWIASGMPLVYFEKNDQTSTAE